MSGVGKYSNGSWRSILNINVKGVEPIDVQGEMQVLGHYFKDGNVHFDANHQCKGIIPLQGRQIPFIDQFSEWRSCIDRIENVVADENCGYRAIAELLNLSGEWEHVRQDLHDEMHCHPTHYTELFGGDKVFLEMKSSLMAYGVSGAPTAGWMTMPEMGFLIASCYRCVLYLLSPLQSRCPLAH